MGYGFLLALTSMLVFVWLFIRSPLHRAPIALILCGMLAMRMAYLLDAVNLNPVAPMDPTVLVFNFTGAMYALALLRLRLFDLIPIARETVIAQMREGMLVLDLQRRVVDLNRAAEQILGVSAARIRGCAAQAPSTYSDWAPLLDDHSQSKTEIILETNHSARYYVLQLSPIQDRRGLPLANLILFHDVTEQKQAQTQLLEQQRVVAALQERERLARELHDDLAQMLAFVSVQAQACHELLVSQNTTQADTHVLRLATIAREAHANLRTLIANLRTPTPTESDLIQSLQEYLSEFGKDNSIQTEFCLPTPPAQVAFAPNVQSQLFRIIQEALTNTRKHARACRASVALATLSEQARVVIEDDGIGFDPRSTMNEEKHLGLRIIRERAAEAGGRIELHSAPGRGTRVVVEVPIKIVNSETVEK